MMWLVFALLTAVFISFKDVISKKMLKNIDEYYVAFFLRFIVTISVIPFLIIYGIPKIGNEFWFALLIGGGINFFTTVLYMKALKYSDVSKSIPMLTFTPLFLLLTSPLILGEYPNLLGIIGMILIVSGSYYMNIASSKISLLEPFKVLVKEKGPRYMLIIAFLWSISANYDKVGVMNSDKFFWIFCVDLFVTLMLIPFVIKRRKIVSKSKIKKNIWFLLSIGFFTAVALMFQMTAITMTLVAYVISVKRTSAIMVVILGGFVLKEKGIKERLIGSIIMVIGVIVIGLTG